jgi:hypothetical protein
MSRHAIRYGPGYLALALLLIAPQAGAMDAATLPAATAGAMAQAASPQAIAEYRRKLREYQEARAVFEQEASAYWGSIADKRRGRNAKRRDRQSIGLDDYVLTQPPVYAGPKRPVDPSPAEPDEAPRPRKTIPVVADLLKAALEHFQFTPQRPADEVEFKRAYARVASAAGLTREQAVRVYSFETGGNGNHDMQSGLSASRPGSRAISTAIDRKNAVLKRMVAYARSVPDEWAQHEKLGDTPQGWALHAMVLDIDVGPLLQTHKLLTSVIFARAKGYSRALSAAELEMMNLTGDGTGLDMVTMPQPMREQVPTSNFFQRGGYERNPVAIRNNTVAKLLDVTDRRMDSNSNLPGAKDLAAAF